MNIVVLPVIEYYLTWLHIYIRQYGPMLRRRIYVSPLSSKGCHMTKPEGAETSILYKSKNFIGLGGDIGTSQRFLFPF